MGIPEVATAKSFATDTDDALLAYIGMKKDCPDDARSAWEEFFVRYRKYVLALCEGKYHVRDGARAEDIVQETILLVWNHAESFDARGETQNERVTRMVLKWLGWQTRKAYGCVIGKDGRQPQLDARIESRPAPDLHPSESQSSPPRLVTFNNAFNALSEREQHVLRTLYEYRDSTTPNAHTPDDVLNDLAAQLSTTSENIRQIHRRAKTKLRAAMAGKQ